MRYAIINDETTLTAALELAKGSYQRDILMGREALSGATLRGKAKKYSGRYKQSAQNIISRCQRRGLAVREVTGPHGKRMVEIGNPVGSVQVTV